MLSVALRHAFEGFSLDVAFEAPEGVTALFGPSGSGKTSILRAVAGLMEPDEARIQVGGQDLSALPPEARGVGFVFQDARLFPHLSVAENLRFGQRLRGQTADIDQIVALLDLENLLERRPRGLSGGEAQRVAIGRALLSAPRILCMDEPLASLDALRKSRILPYLERVTQALDLPVLYVTHDIAEVARLANTLVFLQEGRITRAGPLDEMMIDPGTVAELGLREAGAVLTLKVRSHDATQGLTLLEGAALRLTVPGIKAPAGEKVRVRIAAQDIILATQRPEALSALNIFECVVRRIVPDGAGRVGVTLQVGDADLLARITQVSVNKLPLAPGVRVFAIVKAAAFDPEGMRG